ncbi:MAG: hypothetical protein JWM59_3410 [Verrucomicrobiales bacterium]|nr:hypothetical protein [Verrucomicrobiales bacterium]
MIFRQPQDFAIKAHPGPSDPQWRGCGRIRVHVQGVRIGDIIREHCLLLLGTERFLVLHPAVDSLWDASFAGLSDVTIFTILDRAL